MSVLLVYELHELNDHVSLGLLGPDYLGGDRTCGLFQGPWLLLVEGDTLWSVVDDRLGWLELKFSSCLIGCAEVQLRG